MSDTMTNLALAGFALVGLAMLVAASLKAWQGWLEVRRIELAGHGRLAAADRGPAGDMIEMADLKERIRKLEAIASCVDL